jgi:hypothetical protein
MKEKFLPWFLLFCALGLSGTAAYYSVVGLSIVFVGVALPVIIMGSFLEISKIAIATYLHDKWKETYGILKIYMSIALVTLSIITSLGIYGLLSTGFQGNIAKLEINEKRIKNVEVKKKRGAPHERHPSEGNTVIKPEEPAKKARLFRVYLPLRAPASSPRDTFSKLLRRASEAALQMLSSLLFKGPPTSSANGATPRIGPSTASMMCNKETLKGSFISL